MLINRERGIGFPRGRGPHYYIYIYIYLSLSFFAGEPYLKRLSHLSEKVGWAPLNWGPQQSLCLPHCHLSGGGEGGVGGERERERGGRRALGRSKNPRNPAPCSSSAGDAPNVLPTLLPSPPHAAAGRRQVHHRALQQLRHVQRARRLLPIR